VIWGFTTVLLKNIGFWNVSHTPRRLQKIVLLSISPRILNCFLWSYADSTLANDINSANNIHAWYDDGGSNYDSTSNNIIGNTVLCIDNSVIDDVTMNQIRKKFYGKVNSTYTVGGCIIKSENWLVESIAEGSSTYPYKRDTEPFLSSWPEWVLTAEHISSIFCLKIF
jgi:hypothetical protein